MSNVLILKVADEDLSEEEGIEVIKNIAKNFNLRVSFHGHEGDDERYDLLASVSQMHVDDAQKSLDAGNLVPLVDDDNGIIGYILDGEHVHDLMSALNGYAADDLGPAHE